MISRDAKMVGIHLMGGSIINGRDAYLDEGGSSGGETDHGYDGDASIAE